MRGLRLRALSGLALALTASASLLAAQSAPDSTDKKPESADKAEGGKFEPFKPESTVSNGTVSIGGQTIAYQAVAGTFVVHPKDWDDVPRDPKADKGGGSAEDADSKNPSAEASIFYVAYFKNGG